MIIKSILDSDLYKFSQMNAVAKLYPNTKVRYEFINRGKHRFPKYLGIRLKDELWRIPSLLKSEKEFLRDKCYFFDPAYLDLLEGYKYDPNEVKITQNGGDLKVVIEGYWYRTILWEVPLMAMISELNYAMVRKNVDMTGEFGKVTELINKKSEKFKALGIKFADFGTRRRYAYWYQNLMVSTFSPNKNFVGTSNVSLAHKYDLTPIGTQAHEWYMFHAAKYGFKMATRVALGRWVDAYHGNLGIALTDTFTSDEFFRSFDTLYAKLFDGVRQDSGSPFEFADKAIKHYEKLRIDPLSKTIVFSDGLNYDFVKKIEKYVNGRIKTSYGIGTYLTNDIPEVKPLNMVIKMTAADPDGNGKWIPTIKLSDSKTKYTGNKDMIKRALQEIKGR